MLDPKNLAILESLKSKQIETKEVEKPLLDYVEKDDSDDANITPVKVTSFA